MKVEKERMKRESWNNMAYLSRRLFMFHYSFYFVDMFLLHCRIYLIQPLYSQMYKDLMKNDE